MDLEGNWRWWLLACVAPVAWGSTYVVTKAYLPADQPLWGAAIRALPAGLLLLAVARALPSGSWWWRSAVLGVLNTSAFFAAATLVEGAPPVLDAAALAGFAYLSVVGTPGLAGETPTARQLLGIVLVGAGILLGGPVAAAWRQRRQRAGPVIAADGLVVSAAAGDGR